MSGDQRQRISSVDAATDDTPIRRNINAADVAVLELLAIEIQLNRAKSVVDRRADAHVTRE
jgi:hypothetical protein